MKLAALLVLAGSLLAADGPQLFYSKSFPGSVPPYVEITLAKSGAVEYREAPGEENPIKFQLSAADAGEVFDLVSKTDTFQHPLESPAKVAFMGTKTFRYENGAEKHEVKFNYTQDATGQMLADWFEKMAESAQRKIELERTVKYDKLGVLQSLLQLQLSMDKKRVVAPEQYLPLLDRVTNNESYMHTARTRAAEIASGIRNPKP